MSVCGLLMEVHYVLFTGIAGIKAFLWFKFDKFFIKTALFLSLTLLFFFVWKLSLVWLVCIAKPRIKSNFWSPEDGAERRGLKSQNSQNHSGARFGIFPATSSFSWFEDLRCCCRMFSSFFSVSMPKGWDPSGHFLVLPLKIENTNLFLLSRRSKKCSVIYYEF